MEKPSPRSRSHSRKPSRRSTTNLNHLTLAPLTTTQPLVDGAAETSQPRTSYLEDQSAPTTPSILSRSGSRKQLAPNSSRNLKSLGHGGYGDNKFVGPGFTAVDSSSSYAYLGEQLGLTARPRESVTGSGGLPKAKSSTALSPPPAPTPPATVGPDGKRRHHQRSRTGGSLRSPLAGHNKKKDDDDGWLQRVGTIIASETRDAKGQSWLVSRQSSTSLVDRPNSSDEEAHSAVVYTSRRGSKAQVDVDEELGIQSPRFSRWASRNTSRAASRRHSVHGGSRAEVRTPTRLRTPVKALSTGGYFGDVDMEGGADEPDFVDPREQLEEERQDEDEVARLTKERNLGLGGWVDNLIGFSLFNVDEDREESSDEAVQGGSAEEAKRRRWAELKRRKEEKERLLAKQQRGEGEDAVEVEKSKEEQGGWQDAAWLLSVASKILI